MRNRSLCVYTVRLYWKNPTKCAVQRPEAGLYCIYPIFSASSAESARFSGHFIGENAAYVPEMGERSPYPAQNPI